MPDDRILRQRRDQSSIRMPNQLPPLVVVVVCLLGNSLQNSRLYDMQFRVSGASSKSLCPPRTLMPCVLNYLLVLVLKHNIQVIRWIAF